MAILACARARLWCALVVLGTVSRFARAATFNEYVTELTESDFESKVIKSAETWVIMFYAPWCGHCQRSAPSFSKAAKRLHGVVRLGAVDCDKHGSMAQKYGVQGFPTFKTFSGVGKRARRPSDYNGDRSASAISSHARYIQPSFVARVMPAGIDSFFNDLPKLSHVLLFTDKKETSGLYKGMSARYHNRIAFGEARKNDGPETATAYGVEKYPTMLVFAPGNKDKDAAVMYPGKMDPDSLIKYFDKLAEAGVDAASEGVEAAPEEESKGKVFAQPKAYDGTVETIASKSEYETKCGSRNDGRLCILGLLPGGIEHELKNGIDDVAKRYLYDNIAFAVIDTQNSDGSNFAKSLFESALFVAVRARKNKFSPMNSDASDISALTSFVDRVVGGEVRYSKMADLPDWAAEPQPNEESKDNDASCGEETETCSANNTGAKTEL